MGGDFPPPCMACARGTTVARRGEHPAHTLGAHSASTITLTEVVPTGAQGHVGANATAPFARSLLFTVAHVEQAPCDVQWHAETSANSGQLSG